MTIALTRAVSPMLGQCELTHLERNPINIKKAAEQHQQYEQALERMGFNIRRIEETPHLPDGVFVEDTAVVFPELAVITRPGAETRREETKTMASVLEEYRELRHIRKPGTIDGGDVLIVGKNVYIGLTRRSNREGIRQFSEFLKPFGYHVTAVPVNECLHLKTAMAVLEEDLMLINPEWVSPDIFDGFRFEFVSDNEPYGANVMRKEKFALCPKVFKQTFILLEKLGYDVIAIDQSELAKAEAGLTCCSVIVEVNF
jgi:dimethylargininase